MEEMTFYKLFLEFVQSIYDAENQIVEAIPLLVKYSANPELKEALRDHLKETKEQVKRLERLFKLLGEEPKAKKCLGIKGLLQEGELILEKNNITPTMKDCFIIVAAQKVEHYEIATYGSVVALVEHLKDAWEDKAVWKEICNILKDSLAEEKAADAKLTKIAEGGFFKKGINNELEREIEMHVAAKAR